MHLHVTLPPISQYEYFIANIFSTSSTQEQFSTLAFEDIIRKKYQLKCTDIPTKNLQLFHS